MLEATDLLPGMVVRVHSPIEDIDQPKILWVKSTATMNPSDYGWWIFDYDVVNVETIWPKCSYSSAYKFELLDKVDLTLGVLADSCA